MGQQMTMMAATSDEVTAMEIRDTLLARTNTGQSQPVDRLKLLYPMVNEEETPLPRSWSTKDKYNYIGLSQNNLRVHYKGTWAARDLRTRRRCALATRVRFLRDFTRTSRPVTGSRRLLGLRGLCFVVS